MASKNLSEERRELEIRIDKLEKDLEKQTRRAEILVGSIRTSKNRDRERSKLDRLGKKKSETGIRLIEARKELTNLLFDQTKAPEIFRETSRVFVDKDENVHAYLGYLDPSIGPEHHGHQIVNRFGKIIYTRLPFEEHGPQNLPKNLIEG